MLGGLISANLNVSEAARLLYMHRNTLMNRIERIRQQTGYDPQSFTDALVLWIANALHGNR
ncbi:MAG: helix-turn-helix domain-containing protein [Alicyclobacillus sp.]|nr:helix-turn-helix domain-containing protein [Alicyclobacillus sp.]